MPQGSAVLSSKRPEKEHPCEKGKFAAKNS